jgi:HPt (histidine-containing phosphotransfer) domain-containing protein
MSDLIDTEVLDNLIGYIGEDAAKSVVDLFIGECRDLTAVMSAPGADRVAVGRAAHSLKSSSGQVGAAALSQAALAVETAAGTAAPELPQLIAALARCAADTREALAVRLPS